MRLQSKKSYLRLRLTISVFGILLLLVCFQNGCSSLRVPAIDPSGTRIFKQGGTPLLTPRSAQNNPGNFNQLGQPIAIAPAYQPQPFTTPTISPPQMGLSQSAGGPRISSASNSTLLRWNWQGKSKKAAIRSRGQRLEIPRAIRKNSDYPLSDRGAGGQ